MNCRRCRALASSYLDDRLDAAVRADFDAHLADCAACAAALDVLQKTSAALRAEPAAEPRPGLAERLTRGALGAPAADERPSLLDRWIAVARPAAVASAIAATLMLFILGRTGGAPPVVDEDPVAAVAPDDVAEDDALAVLAMEEE